MLNTASLLMIDQKFLTTPVHPEFDGEERTTFLNAIVKHQAKVTEVGVEEEKILKDRGASDEGKRTRLATLGNAQLSNFEFVQRLIEKAQEAKSALLTRMLDPITAKPKGDATVIFLREQELRRSIPKEDANTFYLRALETDDLETVRAISDAPGPSWVSPDIRRRGEDAYMKRTNLKAYARLQAVGQLLDHLNALAESTRKWLEGLGADAQKVGATLKGAS